MQTKTRENVFFSLQRSSRQKTVARKGTASIALGCKRVTEPHSLEISRLVRKTYTREENGKLIKAQSLAGDAIISLADFTHNMLMMVLAFI